MEHPAFAAEVRNALLMICGDGVSPHLNGTLSIHILAAAILNFPPELRGTFEYMQLLGILDDPCKNTRLAHKVIIDDYKTMFRGVPMYDALTNESFLFRAKILCMVHDYQGFSDASSQSYHQSYHGCVKCTLRGTYCHALHKMVHHPLLLSREMRPRPRTHEDTLRAMQTLEVRAWDGFAYAC